MTRNAELAEFAVIWGLPLVMHGRYLDSARNAGVPFNRLFMSSEIASPKSRAIGPNIDTVNGRAWIDLSDGPVVIGVPDTADRYYTVQLQDMWMNSFAYIGRRTYGTQAGYFAVTPPGFAGSLPAGITAIEAPTTMVLAFSRTLLRGPDDLPAVNALNASFTIGPLSAWPDGLTVATVRADALDAFQPECRKRGLLPHQDIAQAGLSYFDELDRLVRLYPPRATDAANLARLVPLGIGTDGPTTRDADLASAVSRGVEKAITAFESWSDNGWSRRRNLTSFIADPIQRAAIAAYGPGTQVAEESVFFNMRQGPDGEPLDGTRRYRLRFAAGELPPVDAFWSLTLYDRNYFLFANPIDRYGITDRTKGLRYDKDGALEIIIQADEPAEGPANWLPAPREPFELILRTYQPKAAVIEQRYSPPPLTLSS